jgi:hypothetical protein
MGNSVGGDAYYGFTMHDLAGLAIMTKKIKRRKACRCKGLTSHFGYCHRSPDISGWGYQEDLPWIAPMAVSPFPYHSCQLAIKILSTRVHPSWAEARTVGQGASRTISFRITAQVISCFTLSLLSDRQNVVAHPTPHAFFRVSFWLLT